MCMDFHLPNKLQQCNRKALNLFVGMHELVILDIGTNDLVGNYYGMPGALASVVVNLAEKIINLGAKRVAILKILYRWGVKSAPRNQNLNPQTVLDRLETYEDAFNAQVKEYNKELQARTKNKKYFNNIKSAI